MGFLKRPTLRSRDDQRTRAAELTLRESIYPLCLVTILFFLWVSYGNARQQGEWTDHYIGFLVRPYRYLEQALPGRPRHNSCSLVRLAGSILWRIPARFSRPCQLATAPLGLQSYLHLGALPLWFGVPACVAMSCIPVVWRLLRGYLRNRQRTRLARDGSEPLPS